MALYTVCLLFENSGNFLYKANVQITLTPRLLVFVFVCFLGKSDVKISILCIWKIHASNMVFNVVCFMYLIREMYFPDRIWVKSKNNLFNLLKSLKLNVEILKLLLIFILILYLSYGCLIRCSSYVTRVFYFPYFIFKFLRYVTWKF